MSYRRRLRSPSPKRRRPRSPRRRHFSEQHSRSNQSWHRRYWESRQSELAHKREGDWQEHEGPCHTKMAHKREGDWQEHEGPCHTKMAHKREGDWQEHEGPPHAKMAHKREGDWQEHEGPPHSKMAHKREGDWQEHEGPCHTKMAHKREGDWQEHEGPPHAKMAHKPAKRRQEEAEARGRPAKQPRLDSPSDHPGPSSSQKPQESMESTKELATKETNVTPVVYVSSVPGKYYQWVGTEDTRLLCATDALRELHRTFAERLLKSRNIPSECSLLSETDSTSCCGVRGPSTTEGVGCSEEMTTDGEGVSVGSGRELSEAMEEDLRQTTPGVEAVPGVVVGRDGSAQDGSSGKQQSSGFSLRRLIHDLLCCNAPARFCGRRSAAGRPCWPQHKLGVPETELSSSLEQCHSYLILISPELNFKASRPTVISTSEGSVYSFDGFSVISTVAMDNVPPCSLQRYGCEYTLQLKRTPLPQNFTLKDVLLVEEHLFLGVLELYDWAETLKPSSRQLLFLPRFVRPLGECKMDVLSMSEVLRHLVSAFQPLVQSADYDRKVEVSRQTFGLLITHPQKSPSCVRVDRLEWPEKGPPTVVHFSSQFNEKIHPDEKKYHHQLEYSELHRKAFKGKLTRKEHFKEKDLRQKLSANQSKSASDLVVEFSADGFHSTGMYTDIVQHVLVLPVLLKHLLFHDSLPVLEEKLQYHFNDRKLLQQALTHTSYTSLYGTAEDHVKTSMSHCGLRRAEHVGHVSQGRGRGMAALEEAVERMARGEKDNAPRLKHNEQLEFLGDAVLEYLCSLHLYHMFPNLTDGQLTMYRRVLVKNTHLTELAEKLHLMDHMLVGENTVLSETCLGHAPANCLEAVLGAVLLDGGLPAVQELLARLIFPQEELYGVWMNYPPHPLQQQHLQGDRHMIPQSDFLQRLVSLEESVGVEFQHIRLLARAFTHSSVGYTNLTLGSYQRMEFLGDAVLQFLASSFVYHHFPAHHEGHLSLLRTSLVHNKQLAQLSKQLGFDKYILTIKTEKVSLTGKILADVVESFLAALMLDKGLAFAYKFLDVCLFPKLPGIVRSTHLIDANTRLHQAIVHTCKRERIKLEMPQYRTLKIEGPCNKRTITVAVYFRGRRIGVGTGHSTREARMQAAETALTSGALILPSTHHTKSAPPI